MDKLPTLIVTPPGESALTFELKGERIGLGREADNQIQIEIDQISSNHCEFRRRETGYELIDLSSTNGTRVNGKKIAVHELADGDRIFIGETVPAHFVELAEGEAPPEATGEGDEEQNKAATTYVKMDEKLQSIEATIAEKEAEFAAKQKEYEKLQSSLKDLEEKLAAKKAEAGADSEEVKELEKDLMLQTKRVQVMKMDIEEQRAQLNQRPAEHAAPIKPVAPVPMAAPAGEEDEPRPPVAQPVQPVAQAPAAVPVPVATQPLPADGKRTVPVAPATVPLAPPTKRLVVEESGKPRAKLNFGDKPAPPTKNG